MVLKRTLLVVVAVSSNPRYNSSRRFEAFVTRQSKLYHYENLHMPLLRLFHQKKEKITSLVEILRKDEQLHEYEKG